MMCGIVAIEHVSEKRTAIAGDSNPMNPLTRRRFLQYLAGSNLALTGITARGQDILLYQSLADIGPLDPGLP